MGLIHTPLSTDDALRLGSALFFSVVILGAFLSAAVNSARRSFARWRAVPMPRSTYTRNARLAGGFTVLLFAIIINQSPVSVPAVFIGGLLIAPEKFLLLLAAILRSGGKHAATIAIAITKMTEEQIDAKHDDEAEEAEDDDDEPPHGPASAPELSSSQSSRPGLSLRDKVKRVERALFSIVSAEIPEDRYLETYAIVKDNNRSIAYDALILEQNTGSIQTAIEVKYYRTMNIKRVSDTLARSRSLLSSKYYVLLVLVFDSYTNRDLDKLTELRKNFTKANSQVGIVFFKMSNDSLVAIDADKDITRYLQR